MSNPLAVLQTDVVQLAYGLLHQLVFALNARIRPNKQLLHKFERLRQTVTVLSIHFNVLLFGLDLLKMISHSLNPFLNALLSILISFIEFVLNFAELQLQLLMHGCFCPRLVMFSPADFSI